MLLAGLVVACLTAVAGCASSSPPDLESIGLEVQADIQAGSRFEVAFPGQPDAEIRVVSAPTGVIASIGASGTGSNLLEVLVEENTPRGTYDLGISVIRDGEETVLNWPFDVVDTN